MASLSLGSGQYLLGEPGHVKSETKTLQEYEAACLPVACAFVCIETKTLHEYEAVCTYLP
jgi:hypothetical protein